MNKLTKKKLQCLKKFVKKSRQSKVAFSGPTQSSESKPYHQSFFDTEQMHGKLPRQPSVIEKMKQEALKTHMRFYWLITFLETYGRYDNEKFEEFLRWKGL